jgi:hypothetical protein
MTEGGIAGGLNHAISNEFGVRCVRTSERIVLYGDAVI